MNVCAYTSAKRIRLLLNGTVIIEKEMTAADNMTANLSVSYAAGRIEAIALNGVREVERRKF